MEAVAERKTHHDNPHLGERNEVIENNLRLVHKVCHKYNRRAYTLGIEYDDIFSVGSIGLIKAYERFDPTRFDGSVTKFSTYAIPMIQGEIQRFFRDYDTGAKFSRQVKEVAYLIIKNNWDDKRPEEIAELAEVTIERVLEGINYLKNGHVRSLNQAVNEDGDSEITLQDQIISSEDYTTIIVEDFKACLSERDRTIVELLLENKTQYEIAEVIGVSQVQVSRLSRKLQGKLTDYLNEKKVKAEIIELPVKKKGGKPMEQEAKVSIECTKENYEMLKAKGINDNQIAVKYFGMKSGANLYHCLVQWGIKTKGTRTVEEKVVAVEETRNVIANDIIQHKDITSLMKALLDGQEVSIKEESTAKNIMQALDLIGAKYSKEQAFMVKLA